MKIKFLTTSFPKFQNDSHAPWILSMAEKLVSKGHKVSVYSPSNYDLKGDVFFNGVKVNGLDITSNF